MSDARSFATLLTKVRSLELDAREVAVLGEILRRSREADRPEVEGFGVEVGALGLDTRSVGPTSFKGSDEELQVLFGPGRTFKGSDEELQALAGWLRG